MKTNYIKPFAHFININSDNLMQAISAGGVGGGGWDDADAKKSFWDEMENDDTNLWGSVWED